MKQLGQTKQGDYLFECSECEHLARYKRAIVHKCTNCGHDDTMRQVIKYDWALRPAGYSRVFPPELMKSARASIKRAEQRGIQFQVTHTFAGLSVVVLSIPPPSTSKEIIF